jgi:hypothetical protein
VMKIIKATKINQ